MIVSEICILSVVLGGQSHFPDNKCGNKITNIVNRLKAANVRATVIEDSAFDLF